MLPFCLPCLNCKIISNGHAQRVSRFSRWCADQGRAHRPTLGLPPRTAWRAAKVSAVVIEETLAVWGPLSRVEDNLPGAHILLLSSSFSWFSFSKWCVTSLAGGGGGGEYGATVTALAQCRRGELYSLTGVGMQFFGDDQRHTLRSWEPDAKRKSSLLLSTCALGVAVHW